MVDLLIEGLGCGVFGESEDFLSGDTADAAGAADQEESEGSGVSDPVGGGSFSGAGLGRGEGMKLEATKEVVSEDADLLPGAVGAVVVGGDRIEGELAFEFGEGLLLLSSAGDEVPEVFGCEGLVGGHGGVLEVPVVGSEEIELEVFHRLVGDTATVDGDAQGQVPGRDGQLGLEAVHLAIDPDPVALSGDEGLQIQPVKEAHLDGVVSAREVEQSKDFALEKGRIHAELDGQPAPKTATQFPNRLAQEVQGTLAVVDVAGAVTQAQDLPRLRQMRQQRVVALDLAVVGVEPPAGPGHLAARVDERAIHVNGQTRQLQPLDLFIEQLPRDGHQRGQRPLRETLEPVGHRTARRNPSQTAQPPKKRIASDVPQVLQPPGSHRQKPHDQQHQSPSTVVASHPRRIEGMAEPTVQPDLRKEPPKKLQTAVGSQILPNKLHRQIRLADPSKRGYSQAHPRCLLFLESAVVRSFQINKQEA